MSVRLRPGTPKSVRVARRRTIHPLADIPAGAVHASLHALADNLFDQLGDMLVRRLTQDAKRDVPFLGRQGDGAGSVVINRIHHLYFLSLIS